MVSGEALDAETLPNSAIEQDDDVSIDYQLREIRAEIQLSFEANYSLSVPPSAFCFLQALLNWPLDELPLELGVTARQFDTETLETVFTFVTDALLPLLPTTEEPTDIRSEQRCNNLVNQLVEEGLLRRLSVGGNKSALYSVSPLAESLVRQRVNIDIDITQLKISRLYKELRLQVGKLERAADEIQQPEQFEQKVMQVLFSSVEAMVEKLASAQDLLIRNYHAQRQQLELARADRSLLSLDNFEFVFENMKDTAEQISDLREAIREAEIVLLPGLEQLIESAQRLQLDKSAGQIQSLLFHLDNHTAWARQEIEELRGFFERFLDYLNSRLLITKEQKILEILDRAIEVFPERFWGLKVVKPTKMLVLQEYEAPPPPLDMSVSATDENPEQIDDSDRAQVKAEAMRLAANLIADNPNLTPALLIPALRRSSKMTPNTQNYFETVLLRELSRLSHGMINGETPDWQPISESEDIEEVTLCFPPR